MQTPIKDEMIHVPYMWHPAPTRDENVYVMFQAEVHCAESLRVKLDVFGYSLYRVYIDGQEILEGPARFAPDHPEFDTLPLRLTSGSHLLSIVVHQYGVHNRILMGGIDPFLQCRLRSDVDHQEIQLEWHCQELAAYAHIGRRVNGELGWMEICDTRKLPDVNSLQTGEDWVQPVMVNHPLGDVAIKEKSIPFCLRLPVEAKELARGVYTNRFGYENDDPPVRFLARDLQPSLPPEGSWVRVDLGKIGLYRPRIELDLPTGTVIEAGYAESLSDGRVHPVIPLSASVSSHLDRWVTKGEPQVLQTFAPRGFRYLELHIASNDPECLNNVRIVGEQRTMYGEANGSFACSNPLLEKIWTLGTDTMRACSEDALIDTPTRERGQWVGDASFIGMDILAVSFGDLSLIRRGLEQASYRRKPDDGLAAGLCPGQEAYLTSYALYWILGSIRYAELTGDESLLELTYDTAVKTLDVFASKLTNKGAARLDAWDFLDWGHEVPTDHASVSLNLLYLHTLQRMTQWEAMIGQAEQSEKWQQQAIKVRAIVDAHYLTEEGLMKKSVPLDGNASVPSVTALHGAPPRSDNEASTSNSSNAGYHANVFGLLFHLFAEDQRSKAADFVRGHILNCFPNNPSAPRLAHPSANNDQLITPSFAHFALQALWEEGDVAFVMQQYETCWGWMLEQEVTTLLEVFDPRWSQCHAWAGSPTWQCSRYVLGMLPVKGEHYRLLFQPGSLAHASGKVPFVHTSGNGAMAISWRKDGDGNWSYQLDTTHPLEIELAKGLGSLNEQMAANVVEVDGVELTGETSWRVEGALRIQFKQPSAN